ncbi:MAG TPA: hypothetical protein VK989_04270 [Polyangia bacterium]|jgi:hypothetical protein|nr:hypothetical protein [Polyangia bacterium]
MRTQKIQTFVFSVGIALLAAAGVTGCGATLGPVLNPSHVPVVGATAGNDRAVHDAILRAIVNKGWTVAGDAPGVVRASIQKETLTATVAIAYTGSEFSITHESSSPGLKFDGTRIHKHYNTWVNNLRAQITAELQKPVAPPS